MHETFLELEKELKLKQIENGRLRTDNDILERKVDKEHRAMLHFQQAAEDAKTPLIVAQAEIESLKKELQIAHKHQLQITKAAETVEREKDIQVKAKERAEEKTREQIDLRTEQERNAATLAEELQDYKVEIQKLRKVVFQLERDRERLGNEVTDQRGLFMVIIFIFIFNYLLIVSHCRQVKKTFGFEMCRYLSFVSV